MYLKERLVDGYIYMIMWLCCRCVNILLCFVFICR